jgi:hypothetical protein
MTSNIPFILYDTINGNRSILEVLCDTHAHLPYILGYAFGILLICFCGADLRSSC